MLSYICLAPVAILGAAGAVLLLGQRTITPQFKQALALVAWALALASAVYMFLGPELSPVLLFVWQPMPSPWPGVSATYFADPLSRFFALAGALAGIFFVVGLRGRNPRTPGLMMVNLACFFNAVFADDLLFLYLGYELLGLSAYLLALAESPTDARGPSFSMPLTYHLGGYGLLAAALLVGSQAGSFRMTSLAAGQMPASFLALVGVTAVARCAQYPLHPWSLATPPVVVPLQHSLQLLAGGYLLARALSIGGGGMASGGGGLVAFGFVSMMLLLFFAIAERDPVRSLTLLAASQMGLVLWGFGVTSPRATAGALLHLLNIVLAQGVAFIALNVLGREMVTRGWALFRVSLWRAPMSMWLFLAAGASLVGAPSPTLGFASRLLVYQGGTAAGHDIYLILAVVASAISLAGLLKICDQAPLLARMTAGARGMGMAAVLAASAALLLLVILSIGGEALVARLQLAGALWTPGQGIAWSTWGACLLGWLGGVLLPVRGVGRPTLLGHLDPLLLWGRLGQTLELGAETCRQAMVLLESHPHTASILIATLFILFVAI